MLDLDRGDDIPTCIKRDKNNVAPFMLDPPEYKDDAIDWVPINPEASPPASPPSWVPPWGAKSPLPDA